MQESQFYINLCGKNYRCNYRWHFETFQWNNWSALNNNACLRDARYCNLLMHHIQQWRVEGSVRRYMCEYLYTDHILNIGAWRVRWFFTATSAIVADMWIYTFLKSEPIYLTDLRFSRIEIPQTYTITDHHKATLNIQDVVEELLNDSFNGIYHNGAYMIKVDWLAVHQMQLRVIPSFISSVYRLLMHLISHCNGPTWAIRHPKWLASRQFSKASAGW